MDRKIWLNALTHLNFAPSKNTFKKVGPALTLFLTSAILTSCTQNEFNSVICYTPLLIILLGLIGVATKDRPPYEEKPPESEFVGYTEDQAKSLRH